MKTLKEYLGTIEGRKQMESDIDDIMDYMDWEKIASVMDFMEWRWILREKDPDQMIERGYKVTLDGGNYFYIPKTKDVIVSARKIINETIYSAMDAEDRGEFKDRYFVDSSGFRCDIEIIDDETRKRIFGEDAPDDFEHSVDITLKFIIEDYMGKFA